MKPDHSFEPASLPKIELHLHLDCSLSYEVVSRLRPSIGREEFADKFVAPSKCTNLADLLARAASGIALMQTEAELRLVCEDLFRQLAEDRVIYAEIRFAPLLHTQKGLQPERVVEIVSEAVEQASGAFGIPARLILCALRPFSAAQSLETVRLVERFRGGNVAALDLAADEAGFSIDNHVAAFHYAMERNIPRTAHAGEARGPESVWETLHHLRPSRIGHGVRSIYDPALIQHLKNHNIHLEVCPSCNVQIDIFKTYGDHPVNRLYEAGVSVGINTDTRTMTPLTLSEEYRRLQHTFGWGKEHFLQCNLNALEAAFIPQDVKQPLKRRLLKEYPAD